MGRIPSGYLFNRLVTLLLTVWIAATLIWIIPRLSPVDPAEIMLGRMAAGAGTVANADQILETLRARFGLEDPLMVQYVKYIRNVVVLDFGLSTASFPTEVSSLIAKALPWTLGLMLISITITFFIGNLLGALMVWERSPKLVRVAIPAAMVFTSIPPILSALLLMWIFSAKLRWFPLTGAYGLTVEPGWTWGFVQSVLYHGFLPALSIVVVTFGFWALGMRGLMITVQGEDYTTLAKAKGLRPRYILYKYMIRNAILPQITAFALKIGLLIAGQVLVERIFAYNGMGKLLYDAILDQDFPVIQGVSYVIILMTALSVFLVDLIYPLIDPASGTGVDAMSSTISIRFAAVAGTRAGLGTAGTHSVIADRPAGKAAGQGLGMNGGQLLAAAIGGCFWNDLHYMAEIAGVEIEVAEVAVDVTLAGTPPRAVRAHGFAAFSGPTEADCEAVFNAAVEASTIANSIAAAVPVQFERRLS